MAVPAVWRLINLLAFIEPKQHAKAHRRDAHKHIPNSGFPLLAFASASGVWVAFPGMRDGPSAASIVHQASEAYRVGLLLSRQSP